MKEGHNKKAWFTGGKINSRDRNSKLIRRGKNFRRIAFGSGSLLTLLAIATVCPLSKPSEYTEAAIGTAKESTLTFLALAPSSKSESPVEGDAAVAFATFSKVNTLDFTIATNNATGYTLTIKSNAEGDAASQLSNGYDVLNSISAPVSEETFMRNVSTEYDNKWGFLPSKFNSADNTDYLPAPVTTSILDVTSAPNVEENKYSIAVGARMDYGSSTGTYTNDTFIIEYVANPVNYTINYDANAGDDEVENMPATQSGAVSVTSIELSDLTPERTGYTFMGWCTVRPVLADGVMACGDALYEESAVFGIDQTTYNITTLYAVWEADIHEVTIKTAEGISSVKLNGEECVSTEGCVVRELAYGVEYPLEVVFEDEYVLMGWENSEGVGELLEDGTVFKVGAGNTTLTPSATQNSYDVTVAMEHAVSVSFENEKYGVQKVENSGEKVSLKHGVKYAVAVEYEEGYVVDKLASVSGEVKNEIRAEKVLYRVTEEAELTVTGREMLVCKADVVTIAEAVCLQDINAENAEAVRESMEEDAEYILTDERDGKEYKVKLVENAIEVEMVPVVAEANANFELVVETEAKEEEDAKSDAEEEEEAESDAEEEVKDENTGEEEAEEEEEIVVCPVDWEEVKDEEAKDDEKIEVEAEKKDETEAEAEKPARCRI